MLGKAAWGRKRVERLHDMMEERDYGQLKQQKTKQEKKIAKLIEAFEIWMWWWMLEPENQLDREGDEERGVGTCQ